MSRKTLPPTGPSTTSKNPEGRDKQGRFAAGNEGGPGNPFARKVAALRKAFVNAVSEKDLADIARMLALKASHGDVAAARLVLSYVIGKPTAPRDPDRMDVEELQQVEDEHNMIYKMPKLSQTPEISLPLTLIRGTRLPMAKAMADRLTAGFKKMDERDAERRRQQELAAGAPTTNGSNGEGEQQTEMGGMPPGLGGMPTQSVGMSATERRKSVPSRNGSNGH